MTTPNTMAISRNRFLGMLFINDSFETGLV
jgi:hypothetical protein